MNKQPSDKDNKNNLIPSLDEEHYLYNKYGYNDQISEVLSGSINERPEMIPTPLPHRLTVINKYRGMSRPSKAKNKGKKKQLRGWSYRITQKDIVFVQNRCEQGEDVNAEVIKQFLWTHLPPGTIRKETKSNIYLLCPFHNENTPSLCIGKERGGHVKCFGCGKSMFLSTLLSQTLGHTRKYWHDQLTGVTKWGNYKHIDPNQLEIPFPDTPENSVE